MPNKNKQRKRQNGASTGGTSPSARPAYTTSDRSERSWGGGGGVSVCPDSVRVSLPYEETLLPTTASAGLYTYQYRGNSVFDPNYTGTGGQPTGFDSWAGLYNEYTVLSSRVTFQVIAGTSGSTEYGIFPSYNTTVPSNSEDGSCFRFARSRIFSANGGAVFATFRQSMSTAQMLGVRKEAILDDDAYGATVGTNPAATAVWYWTIFGQNINNSNSLADVLRIKIEYDVLFHDPVQQQLSVSARRERPALVLPISPHPVTASSAASGGCVCTACTHSRN